MSYLNLSKIDKNSPLFNALSNASASSDKISVSLNVISNSKAAMSAFAVLGTVSGNTREGNQLIKTNFGVITTNNTKMPIGQKLAVQITSINNHSLSTNIARNIGDFIYNVNKNWPILKNLVLALNANNSSPNSVLNQQPAGTRATFRRSQ